jgi:hypothetical protein
VDYGEPPLDLIDFTNNFWFDAGAPQHFRISLFILHLCAANNERLNVECPHYLIPSTPNWLAPNPSGRASPVLGAFRSAFSAILFL